MLQSEAAECGIACLAMVAAFHGRRETLTDLRRRFAASLKGTTLKSLMDMADGLGLAARPLRLEEGPKLVRFRKGPLDLVYVSPQLRPV